MLDTIEGVADQCFDYIVIGGGTAGLALAARLSEDESISVLVLEAGEENVKVDAILRPFSYFTVIPDPNFTWQHAVVKQKHMDNRDDMIWQRGKGLGGTSGINGMIWFKPPAREVDDFERLGNPGWNWANFNEAISRVEGFIDPADDAKTKRMLKTDTWQLGTEGPVKITYAPTFDVAELKIQEAMVNAGLPLASQPFNGDPHGVFYAPSVYDPESHTRSYALTAYYLPNKNRKNMHALTRATVRRVLLNPDGPNGELVATGVEFEYDGKVKRVNAEKEVIVCAGVVQSPHILEHSGIGAQEVLQKANIPLLLDLPGVGENVQEHMTCMIAFALKDDVQFETIDQLRDPVMAAKHLELYAQGLGLFTSGAGCVGYGTLDEISSRAAEIYKSMESVVKTLEGQKTNLGPVALGQLEQYKINLERFRPGNKSPSFEFFFVPGWALPYAPEPGKRYITATTLFNHAFSRGTIHAVSSDPMTESEIDPRYFEQDCDMEAFIEIVKFTRKIINSAPLKDMIAEEHALSAEARTDDEIRAWLRKSAKTLWHTIGSCSMLPRDKGGVVDPDLKVYGTKNLRVADISILPLHFAAHTQSSAYGIGEKVAEIIKAKASK